MHAKGEAGRGSACTQRARRGTRGGGSARERKGQQRVRVHAEGGEGYHGPRGSARVVDRLKLVLFLKF
jgi:hypothetical protein